MAEPLSDAELTVFERHLDMWGSLGAEGDGQRVIDALREARRERDAWETTAKAAVRLAELREQERDAARAALRDAISIAAHLTEWGPTLTASWRRALGEGK